MKIKIYLFSCSKNALRVICTELKLHYIFAVYFCVCMREKNIVKGRSAAAQLPQERRRSSQHYATSGGAVSIEHCVAACDVMCIDQEVMLGPA